MTDGGGPFPRGTTVVTGDNKEESPDAQPHPPRLRRQARRGVEWLVVLAVAGLIAFLVRSFAIETFYVPSGSMTPTLVTGDRILVDKLPWVRDNIHRGDVIVFRRVPADPQLQDADLVKRVVGMPGETISSKGDTVYINGHPLAETWLPPLANAYSEPGHQACAQASFRIPKQTIPAGHYFVMGDCRAISYDSRYWGTVPASYIVGKVTLVIWRHGHPWFHWF